MLRRTQAGDGGLRHLGLLEIDEGRHVVSVDGERLELSPKEFELLVYFADNANLALSRDQILSSVWDYDYFGGCQDSGYSCETSSGQAGPCSRLY